MLDVDRDLARGGREVGDVLDLDHVRRAERRDDCSSHRMRLSSGFRPTLRPRPCLRSRERASRLFGVAASLASAGMARFDDSWRRADTVLCGWRHQWPGARKPARRGLDRARARPRGRPRLRGLRLGPLARRPVRRARDADRVAWGSTREALSRAADPVRPGARDRRVFGDQRLRRSCAAAQTTTGGRVGLVHRRAVATVPRRLGRIGASRRGHASSAPAAGPRSTPSRVRVARGSRSQRPGHRAALGRCRQHREASAGTPPSPTSIPCGIGRTSR